MAQPARVLRGIKKTKAKLKQVKKRSHPDEWKGFGYEGENNTCLWCGYSLKNSYTYDPGIALKRGVTHALRSALGPYEDGHFCSLRCGYQFGARLAHLGDRLS